MHVCVHRHAALRTRAPAARAAPATAPSLPTAPALPPAGTTAPAPRHRLPATSGPPAGRRGRGWATAGERRGRQTVTAAAMAPAAALTG